MQKEIMRVGNSKGIYFDSAECRIYNFNEGDIIDIEPVKIGHVKKEKKK